ncbi:MAG: YfhO family protein [Lachnospiraceae bacterium]|nr:YfhO family protein [Lachnospiraceae bacterium]
MTKKKFDITYILSFVIPVLIAVLAFNNIGVGPGGSNTVLVYDMKAQLLALYGYLSNGGPGYDNLFHSMSGALGGGYYGTLALYVSPFDFIYCLVPTRYLPDAIYCLTIFKIGLCGLSMCFYLKRTRKEQGKGITVALSCCYALMSYVFMYSMSPMWFDAIMLMPLIALSLEKIISGEKSASFVLFVAVCIISDYYIAFMTIIAVTLFFLFRLAEDGLKGRDLLHRCMSYAVHGLLSAGISAFILIPVALDFNRGKLSEGVKSNTVFLKNTLFEVIKMFAPSSYATMDYTAPPNVFCGSIVLLLALFWILYGKKNARARIAGAVVIGIYFLSFIFGPFDRIWHGFRDPVGFPVRYAFTFVFFMICFASRGYETIKKSDLKISPGKMGFFWVIIFIYTYVELFINSGYILSRLAVEERYQNRDEFNRLCENMEYLLNDIDLSDEDGYGRIVRNFHISRFDGALFGYDGMERFSSSYNQKLDYFLERCGIGSSFHTVTDYGENPAMNSLLCVKYYISYYRDIADIYELKDSCRYYSLYENPYAFPLAFYSGLDGEVTSLDDLSDDPFVNINSVLKELAGPDYSDLDVFRKIEYVRHDREEGEYLKADTVGSADLVFETPYSGYYYFYSQYIDPVDDYRGEWASGNFSQKTVFADSYVDGVANGLFRNDEFSFITGAGYFDASGVHAITLDTSLSEIGDTYVYYFDKDAFEQIYEQIKSAGFSLDYIGDEGIILSGTAEEDGHVFVSLPFEQGYKVYVDGKKTDIEGYCDAIMLVPVSAGEHTIEIKYVPPGLMPGAIISVLSLAVLIILCRKTSGKNRSGELK